MQLDEHGFPKAPFQARAHPPRTGAAHLVGRLWSSQACEDAQLLCGTHA